MSKAAEILVSRMGTFEDFPQPGILFRDLTPVFADGQSLRALVDEMVSPFAGQFDAIAGLEARGFILAAAAAAEVGVGVVPIRKAGKLPGSVLRESYELEYGQATFEVSPEVLPAGSRVLIMDDVLATGGTVAASATLIERAGWTVAGVSVALELVELGGRERIGDRLIHSVLSL
ncbi:MAG: adenine phosphoribosyltransferase [Microbacteriaceae bacterium]